MGIQGLLPVLDSVTESIHVQKYAGCKVAIDGYSWLHKGSYSCSSELCQNIPTDKYINYCMHLLRMLKHYKVIPVLVFDGGRLPSKAATEEERRKSRKKNLEQALALLREGQTSAAHDLFRKAVDITPQHAFNLMEVARKEGIECIVAPYEADAQLAYLARTGYVSAVITEDSDLVVYGTPAIIFKMDKFGAAKELRFDNLGNNKKLNFSKFTHEMLIKMCILSGCDYLDSLPKIGVVKAYKLVAQYHTIEKIMEAIRADGSIPVPDDYEQNFNKAFLTFMHARAYDPVKQEVVTITPIPSHLRESDMPFIGEPIPKDLAIEICTGRVDPSTYEPFDKNTKLLKKVHAQQQQKQQQSSTALPKSQKTLSSYFGVPKGNPISFVPPRKASDAQTTPMAERKPLTSVQTTGARLAPRQPVTKITTTKQTTTTTTTTTIVRSKYFCSSPAITNTNNNATAAAMETTVPVLSQTTTTTTTIKSMNPSQGEESQGLEDVKGPPSDDTNDASNPGEEDMSDSTSVSSLLSMTGVLESQQPKGAANTTGMFAGDDGQSQLSQSSLLSDGVLDEFQSQRSTGSSSSRKHTHSARSATPLSTTYDEDEPMLDVEDQKPCFTSALINNSQQRIGIPHSFSMQKKPAANVSSFVERYLSMKSRGGSSSESQSSSSGSMYLSQNSVKSTDEAAEESDDEEEEAEEEKEGDRNDEAEAEAESDHDDDEEASKEEKKESNEASRSNIINNNNDRDADQKDTHPEVIVLTEEEDGAGAPQSSPVKTFFTYELFESPTKTATSSTSKLGQGSSSSSAKKRSIIHLNSDGEEEEEEEEKEEEEHATVSKTTTPSRRRLPATQLLSSLDQFAYKGKKSSVLNAPYVPPSKAKKPTTTAAATATTKNSTQTRKNGSNPGRSNSNSSSSSTPTKRKRVT